MRGFESSTLIKTRKASFAVSAISRQKGAYAVEFAFVFIIFFLVLYGMITYGLIFAAQQSMNFAAESGARAGLQWQADSGALTSLQARAKYAQETAAAHVQWIDQLAEGDEKVVDITVDTSNPDKLEVIISYPYSIAPLVPYLGPSTLLQVAVPSKLESRASVDLNIAQDHSS